MADPTKIVDRVAPIYAQELGEDWETLSQARRERFRALAYKIYEIHVTNKLEGLDMAVEIIEAVQVAESTPKSWLRGVQEAKNALVWATTTMRDDIQTRINVPDVLPDGFNAEDPHKDLRAGDKAPEIVLGPERCGAEHEDNWVCSRPAHPGHWMHYDADPGEFYDDDDQLIESLDGMILATWHHEGERLDSLHPALGELDEE